jgi:hypothetical protein
MFLLLQPYAEVVVVQHPRVEELADQMVVEVLLLLQPKALQAVRVRAPEVVLQPKVEAEHHQLVLRP